MSSISNVLYRCIGIEMDITDLKFPDASFDVIIDKGMHWKLIYHLW